MDLVLQHYRFPFEFHGFQKDTVNELAYLERTGCFMDVGTGKTCVATAMGLYKALENEIDQIVVLMPPILLDQWEEWFSELKIDVLKYAGSPAKRRSMDLGTDVVLMSFGIFKNDFDRITKFYKDRGVFLIVDEAAALRNPGTLTFKAVRDFMELPQKQCTLLTGTAINRPHHVYGYVKIKTPNVYRDYRQFKSIHIISTDIFGEPNAFARLDLLQESLMLNSVVVKADEVLDLPPITYAPVVYDLGAKHKKLYDKVVEEKLVVLDDGEVIDGTVQQRLYNAVQRVILKPASFGGDKIQPAGFALIDALADELGMFSSSGEKLVIYVNYRESNQAVFDYVSAIKNLTPIQAYGEVGAAGNLRNIKRFLTEPEINVGVFHPGSVGIGMNLQHVCRACLFLELPLTSNIFTQAIGRFHREGQKRNVVVKFGIAKGTIQQTLQRRVVRKEDEIQQIMPTRETLRKALFGQ